MALVNMKDMLDCARKGRYAVANFDVFNIEMLKGVLEAAEETRSPVIVAYGEGFDDYIAIDAFTPLVKVLAEKASVPVALHLDHAVSYKSVAKAIYAGFTSVMVDASDKPFEENIAATKRVVELGHALGVTVESEIGHVSGIEGLFENDEYIYTSVDEARAFVEATNVDALAIAIGTVHGVYKEKPQLNIERIREIRDAVDVALVLHGGSGLSDDDFRACIENGVVKINIFTDLTLKAAAAARETLKDDMAPLMKVALSQSEAVKNEAIVKIKLFGSAGKA